MDVGQVEYIGPKYGGRGQGAGGGGATRKTSSLGLNLDTIDISVMFWKMTKEPLGAKEQ